MEIGQNTGSTHYLPDLVLKVINSKMDNIIYL